VRGSEAGRRTRIVSVRYSRVEGAPGRDSKSAALVALAGLRESGRAEGGGIREAERAESPFDPGLEVDESLPSLIARALPNK
jgi:hypothetical protein